MYFYVLLFLSFILGSIPFGKIIGLSKGIDIQKKGSGNIGFANSLRVMGPKAASIVLVGDIVKGYIPVYFTLHRLTLTETLFVSFAAIAGHIFSPWLKGKGGKGVATIIGVSLALNVYIGMLGMTIWTLVFLLKKIPSIASVTIAILMPLLAAIVEPQLVYFYIVLLVVILITHRLNMRNMSKSEKIHFT